MNNVHKINKIQITIVKNGTQNNLVDYDMYHELSCDRFSAI